MKILLINPTQQLIYGARRRPPYPALGLLSIGAVLKGDGHEVEVIDVDADGFSDERILSYVARKRFDLVGLTASTPMINGAVKIAGMIKNRFDSPTMIGGIHATMRPEETLRTGAFDYLVRGEGEATAQELAARLATGEDPRAVAGLCHLDEAGRFIANPPRPLIDPLDQLPWPERDLIKNPNNYRPPDARRLPAASIMPTRGCFANCTFCCTKHIFGRRIRSRSTANIIAEIEDLISRHGAKEIHVVDDVFTYAKKKTLEFCRAVKEAGLEVGFAFPNGVRADTVDEETLAALKSVGVRSLSFGVESGNEDILKKIKKGESKEDIRRAFALAKKMGFETWGFFIIGLPGEDEASAAQTIDFAKELDPDFAKFSILKPFPGTEVYEELAAAGLVDDSDYDLFGNYMAPVHRLPGMTSQEIWRWQKKATRAFYLRPQKILGHLRRIKSWSQIKTSLDGLKFVMTVMRPARGL